MRHFNDSFKEVMLGPKTSLCSSAKQISNASPSSAMRTFNGPAHPLEENFSTLLALKIILRHPFRYLFPEKSLKKA